MLDKEMPPTPSTKRKREDAMGPEPTMSGYAHQPRKIKVARRKVKIGGNKYHCFLMNELQKNSSDESSDNENSAKHIQNVDNTVETVHINSRNAENSEEQLENDNVLLSLKCQLCRMCGKKQSALIPIFKTNFANEIQIFEKIELHIGLKVRMNDGLPPNICLTCNSLLQAWHTLYVSSIAADTVLHQMFKVATDSMSVCSQEDCDERSEECSSFCHLMDEHSVQPEEECRMRPTEMQISSEECMNQHISCDQENLSHHATDNLLLCQRKVKCCYCSKDVEKVQLKEHKVLCQLEKTICKICGINIQRRHMKTHISKVHEKTQLCEMCGNFFSCHDFKTHKGECHREPTTFCELCFRLFFSEQGYEIHLKGHERGTRKSLGVQIKVSSQEEVSSSYICPVCGDNFPNKLSLVVHLNTYKSVTCEPCAEDFRNERAFLVHVSLRGKFWHCRYCFQTFDKKYSLKIHEQTHCPKDKTFDCRKQKKKYSSLESLTQPILSHGSYSYNCSYCDKKFNCQSHLKEHILQHAIYIYKCNTCRKLFPSFGSLQVHFENLHKRPIYLETK